MLVPFTGGIAVGSVLGGRFADRHSRRNTISLGTAGGLVFGGAFAALTFLPPARPVVFVLGAAMALFGAALGFNWPAQLSITVEWFPTLRGTAVGFYNFTRFLGSSIGALLSGYITDHYGVTYAFLAIFGTFAISLIIARTLVREPEQGEVVVGAVLPRPS